MPSYPSQYPYVSATSPYGHTTMGQSQQEEHALYAHPSQASPYLSSAYPSGQWSTGGQVMMNSPVPLSTQWGSGTMPGNAHSPPVNPPPSTPSYPPNAPQDGAQPVHEYRQLHEYPEELLRTRLREASHEGRRGWCCNACGEFFSRRTLGYNHVLRQHLAQDKLYECIVCREKFNSENSARRHRDYQIRRFVCNICNRSYARPDYVRAHQVRCEQRHGVESSGPSPFSSFHLS